MSNSRIPANLGLILGLLLSVLGLTACESSNPQLSQSSIEQTPQTADNNQTQQQEVNSLADRQSPPTPLEPPASQGNQLDLPQVPKDQIQHLSSTDYAICQDYPTPSICLSERLELQQESESQAQEQQKIQQQRRQEDVEQQDYEQQLAQFKEQGESNQPQSSSPLLVSPSPVESSSPRRVLASQTHASSSRSVLVSQPRPSPRRVLASQTQPSSPRSASSNQFLLQRNAN